MSKEVTPRYQPTTAYRDNAEWRLRAPLVREMAAHKHRPIRTAARWAALEAGLTCYTPESPCLKCGTSERRTKTYKCVQCAKANAALSKRRRWERREVIRLRRDTTVTISEAAIEPFGQPLTAREREVVALLMEGCPIKQIIVKLGVTDHTVNNHLESIYTKLGARDRTEAAVRWWHMTEGGEAGEGEGGRAGSSLSWEPEADNIDSYLPKRRARRAASIRNGALSVEDLGVERNLAWERFMGGLRRGAGLNTLRKLLSDWHWWDLQALAMEGLYAWGNRELQEKLEGKGVLR